MKTSFLSVALAAMALPLLAREGSIPNPAIDYDGFARLTIELAPVREKNRVTEEQFIKMTAEPGTVVFDARTTDKFELIHVRGALHLPFTDFTEEALAKVIPDKNTRILIYCNNNFDNEPAGFARKGGLVSLNIQTFINLHAYGYKNVRELGPLLDVNYTRIPLERKAGGLSPAIPQVLPAPETPPVRE